MRKLFFFLLLFSLSFPVFSQSTVTLSGKVYDNDNKMLPLSRLMIINRRTGMGTFADAEGKFSVKLLPADTLTFSALGFRVRNICFKDSILANKLYVEVALYKLQFDLKEVSVFAPRTLSEIQEDIDKLGVKKDYSATGVNAFESPITALYERFSKIARSKAKVAEWENEDLRRDVLKSLFQLYVKYDIIDLPDDEFDAFIRYLNLSDDFIRNATQFELVMAIKGKYESFKYRWK